MTGPVPAPHPTATPRPTGPTTSPGGPYPTGDISTSRSASVLSISGGRDGLATPDDIAASTANLPASATFLGIDGAVHTFFGDYGTQPGDGTPSISHDEARAEISRAAVDFVNELNE